MQVSREIRSQKIGLYCNYVFVALTVIGWLGIAHFWAPARADLGLEATKQWFSADYRWATIIGCTIFYVAAGLLTPGSIAFGLSLARIEGRRPIWSITTGVCGAFISLIIFFNCCAWIVAAYRPETGADVIQSWYDWAWFAFLLGWIYLTVEMVATGIVELLDDRPEPLVPRWFTWLTFAGAATLVFAAGPAFFTSGPFAYHGLLAFYLPVVIWGTYIAFTTFCMVRELDREAAQASETADASDASDASESSEASEESPGTGRPGAMA